MLFSTVEKKNQHVRSLPLLKFFYQKNFFARSQRILEKDVVQQCEHKNRWQASDFPRQDAGLRR